jgi:methionyl-tRNA formyltransferase
MNCCELFEICASESPKLLEQTLIGLTEGTIVPSKQCEDGVCFADKLQKEECKIDWNKSAQEIHNLVRGTNPFPVSYSFDEEGERIKIWSTLLTDIKKPSSKEAGDVIEASAEGIYVATGDGVIKITELQGPSGKRMKAGDYVNGHKITKLT